MGSIAERTRMIQGEEAPSSTPAPAPSSAKDVLLLTVVHACAVVLCYAVLGMWLSFGAGECPRAT